MNLRQKPESRAPQTAAESNAEKKKALRAKLLEMIKRNESLRQAKPR